MSIGQISNFQSSNVQGGGPPQHPSHQDVVNKFGDSLAQEDKDSMLSTIESMQKDGASDKEIKNYVDSTFKEFGIEIPQKAQGPQGAGGAENGPPPPRDIVSDLGSLLSKELSTQLMDTIAAMKEEGADAEEIKTVVDTTLAENGIELPPPAGTLANMTI